MNLGVRDGGGGDYVILVNLCADWRLTYRRAMRVALGEVVIVDARIDALYQRQGEAEPMAFKFSALLMRQWVPDAGVIVGKVIGTQSPWASALSSYIGAVARAGVALDEGHPSRHPSRNLSWHFVPEHLGALLSLAAHELATPQPEIKACEPDKFSEIMQVLQARCADHDLNASLVAQTCAMSPRTLHRVLARNGASYGELVARCRIDRASAMLRARNLRHLSTAEIGYRSGFRDPSNFARVFRQRLGVRPAELRC
jgi:AraC family transcriptional activator of tynA and feaB